MRIAAEVSTHDEGMRALWLGIGERLIEATGEHIRSEQGAGLIPRTLDPRARLGFATNGGKHRPPNLPTRFFG